MVIRLPKRMTWRLMLLLSGVSLFAGMTYEGARSINGPFLQSLGASGTAVGFIAGFGEMVGYGLRLLSHYLSDRSGKYWMILIVGYALNLLSIPLLAYAGYWQIAAILMVAERAGYATHNPVDGALRSHVVRRGNLRWSFRLYEFKDQLGRMLGPLLVSAVLFYKQDAFRQSYIILIFPALVAISLLLTVKKLYPASQKLEVKKVQFEDAGTFSSPGFILYTVAALCLATAYADYPLIAYHFKITALVSDAWIALLYALALFTEAATALITRRLFPRTGVWILLPAVILSMFFAPLVFIGTRQWAITGMVLWGIGMGVQGSVLKTALKDMVPTPKQASALGIFDTLYGVAWFAGSAYMGFLYDRSLPTLVTFSANMQLITIMFLIALIMRNERNIINI